MVGNSDVDKNSFARYAGEIGLITTSVLCGLHALPRKRAVHILLFT
jgi:hypothetical protein